MCGIAGIVDTRARVDRATLERMASAIRHRGPDDEGYYLHVADAERGPNVGLAFRRLSIIDLAGGHQPMSNEDDSVWIAFNGEIYNFQELRRELQAQGHRFRTASDTETIVHLYEEMGDGCVTRLNGMFALAIWDAHRRRLLLARDRMGKKPLYWTDTGHGLLFGSELKALLAHPECGRDIDRAAVAKYLAYEYVPSPHSIFTQVRKLPAAHTLVWQDGKITVQRYWDQRFAAPAAGTAASAADLAAEFRDRLREAVRIRLVSDVPLGVFLSGGIDSSSVVALMAQLRPPESIQTFAVGFADPSFDESAHARAVAQHFGTDHHEEVLAPRTLIDILPEVAGFLDEPFADASIVPTYLLSKFTRQHVTVALGGDGGDELLAGYPTFQAERAARWYRVPGAVHSHVVRPLAARLPVSTDNFSFDFKLKRFLQGVSYESSLRHQVWLGAFDAAESRELLHGDPACDPYDDLIAAMRDAPAHDPVERLIYQYCRFYLQDDILVKVDRASMACSLEVRAPFLDYTLVDWLGTVPSHLKLRGGTTKYLLKLAMQPYLPPGIAARAKKGFGIPVAKWFQGELRDLARDTLSESRLAQHGMFHWPVVARLLDEHFRGRRDNRKQLWTLFMFQLWYEEYGRRADGTRVRPDVGREIQSA
jgi:asparagine synthase (glutamine-hydrolysing)